MRRRALLLSGAGALGLAACGGGEDEERSERQRGDREIVRFALALEQVENAFWREVVERGALQGMPRAARLAREVAANERRHLEEVSDLATRLGVRGAPVARTDFSRVFAGGPGTVLRTAANLENIAAGAYLGQAARIRDGDVLATVIAIHSVEARQAAAVNELAGRPFRGERALQGALPDGAFAEPMTMAEVRRSLERYRAGA